MALPACVYTPVFSLPFLYLVKCSPFFKLYENTVYPTLVKVPSVLLGKSTQDFPGNTGGSPRLAPLAVV